MESLGRREASSVRTERSIGMGPQQLQRLKSMSKRRSEAVAKSPACFRSRLLRASSESKLGVTTCDATDQTEAFNSSLLSMSNCFFRPQQGCVEESADQNSRSLSFTRDIMEEALRIGEDSDVDNSERSYSLRFRGLDVDGESVANISLSDFSYSSWKSYWDMRPSGSAEQSDDYR